MPGRIDGHPTVGMAPFPMVALHGLARQTPSLIGVILGG